MYKGDIKDFPVEVVEKMLYYQVEQGNKRDVSVFEKYMLADDRSGGFDWRKTIEGYDFWVKVIELKDFDLFFERYPKETTELPKENKKPKHYKTDSIDVIDFCHAYNLNFSRGNIIKYVARAGKKDNELEDLKKALDYINREIELITNK